MPNPPNKQISDNRRLLRNPYAFLDGSGGYSAAPKPAEATHTQISANRRLLENQYAFMDDQGALDAVVPRVPWNSDQGLHRSQIRQRAAQGYSWIERAAKDLQARIWRQQNELWPDGVPSDLIEMLDPSLALRVIGFEYVSKEPLGQFSRGRGGFEVAGLIDRPAKRVHVSPQLPLPSRRFTAAHELGHAVLHEGVRMHRDRPMDGSEQERGARDKIEKEADKFATFFLMPEKLVRERFRQAFLCDKFLLNEETRFALEISGNEVPAPGSKSLRELARVLANARGYNGRHFSSLAEQFRVSAEAMAIRLEELGLVDI